MLNVDSQNNVVDCRDAPNKLLYFTDENNEENDE